MFLDNLYDKENKDIKLFFAKNPYSEIEFVASNIHNLVSKCGYRYNEIAVITENLDGFKEDVKVIFNKFHREEIKFDSLEKLKQQLTNDANELDKQIKL